MHHRPFGLAAVAVISVAVLGVTDAARGQALSQGSGTTIQRVQGGGTVQGSTTTMQPKSPAEIFQERFWNYLTKGPAGYDQWGPFPRGKVGMYEGESPHGAFLTLYANKAARSNPKALPAGSIIVKENYGTDRKTLMAVTVMYRVEGYNPAASDWYWIKYNPDGTVSRTPADAGNAPIAGRFASCIDCHGGAEGGDFVFVND